MKEKPFMSLRETAEFLDVSMSCIYKLIQSKVLPCYKPRGEHSKMTYCDRQEIEKWLRDNRHSSQAEAEQQADAYIARKGAGL